MLLPTRRLLVLLAGLSPLFLVDAGLALAGDAALLAGAALDWLTAAGGRLPRVSRRVPSRLVRGGSAGVEVRVVNRRRRDVVVRLTDDLPSHLERRGDDTVKLRVGSRGEAVWTYEVRAAGRGTAPLGDVHLRVRGPLGLAWREVRVPRSDALSVQPGVREMRRLRLLGLRHRLRRAGLRNVRQRGEGRSFESLREYVRGDDPRAVDWKASAHHGNLMVRQYEAERSQNVVLAVDAGRLMMEPLGDDGDRLDHALTAALLLADVAGIHGDHVGLMAFADRIQRFLPPRRGSLARVADALAAVVAKPVEPNYPLAFSTLGRQVGRRSLVVLFTDVVDARASAALLAQLGRSAQRHLVLAVTLRNPELVARADAPADTEEEVYRRVAAEEMLQARGLALALMRRQGVLVADNAPDAVVTDVVNRYLDVKYRGLL